MKNLFILISIYATLQPVYAYQDVLINVNQRAFGLCLSGNSLDNPVCANNTLYLDGREDATVYILPETQIKANSTTGEKFSYGVLTPVNLIAGTVGIFMFVIGLSAACIFLFVKLNKGLIRIH